MTRIAKITLGLFAAILFVSLAPSVTALESEELGIKPQKVNPGSFYYLFKRGWEKMRGVLTFSENARISYNENLLGRRLSELDYVTENNLQNEVEKSSQRLSFYAGRLGETVRDTGSEEDRKRVLDKFDSYAVFLEKIRDRFPANTAQWLFVQQNIDTLDILSRDL